MVWQGGKGGEGGGGDEYSSERFLLFGNDTAIGAKHVNRIAAGWLTIFRSEKAFRNDGIQKKGGRIPPSSDTVLSTTVRRTEK